MISCKKLQKSITNKQPQEQAAKTVLQRIWDYEKCWNEQNKSNEYGRNCAGACEKKIDMSGSNLTAGIPARSIIEVLDTSNNKWINKMLTVKWNVNFCCLNHI